MDWSGALLFCRRRANRDVSTAVNFVVRLRLVLRWRPILAEFRVPLEVSRRISALRDGPFNAAARLLAFGRWTCRGEERARSAGTLRAPLGRGRGLSVDGRSSTLHVPVRGNQRKTYEYTAPAHARHVSSSSLSLTFSITCIITHQQLAQDTQTSKQQKTHLVYNVTRLPFLPASRQLPYRPTVRVVVSSLLEERDTMKLYIHRGHHGRRVEVQAVLVLARALQKRTRNGSRADRRFHVNSVWF